MFERQGGSSGLLVMGESKTIAVCILTTAFKHGVHGFQDIVSRRFGLGLLTDPGRHGVATPGLMAHST